MDNKLKVTLGVLPEYCDEDNAVEIQEFSITYGQSADTNSDRDEFQSLKISAKNNGSGEDGWYFDLEIPDGHWSISNPSDIAEIIEDFTQRMNYKITREKDLKTWQ